MTPLAASKDDEVFFHKQGKPVVGRVAAAGKHGCTIEHDGKPHKVRWEHIAGHKKRAPQQHRVVEEGEDGIIVANQHGHHRFVAIPPEARADQLVLDKPKKTPDNSGA